MVLALIAFDCSACAQGEPIQEPLQMEASVTWSLHKQNHDPDAAPEIVVDATFAGGNNRLRLVIRQNKDKSVPVDYIAELRFAGTRIVVSKVFGLAVRDAVESEDVQLDGLAVQVSDDYWLVGLAAEPSRLGNNLRLLERANILTVPMSLADRQKVVLVLQKGNTGKAVFAQAFNDWANRMKISPVEPPHITAKPFQFPADKILNMPPPRPEEFEGLQPYR